jgi:hypothetical protein
MFATSLLDGVSGDNAIGSPSGMGMALPPGPRTAGAGAHEPLVRLPSIFASDGDPASGGLGSLNFAHLIPSATNFKRLRSTDIVVDYAVPPHYTGPAPGGPHSHPHPHPHPHSHMNRLASTNSDGVPPLPPLGHPALAVSRSLSRQISVTGAGGVASAAAAADMGQWIDSYLNDNTGQFLAQQQQTGQPPSATAAAAATGKPLSSEAGDGSGGLSKRARVQMVEGIDASGEVSLKLYTDDPTLARLTQAQQAQLLQQQQQPQAIYAK